MCVMETNIAALPPHAPHRTPFSGTGRPHFVKCLGRNIKHMAREGQALDGGILLQADWSYPPQSLPMRENAESCNMETPSWEGLEKDWRANVSSPGSPQRATSWEICSGQGKHRTVSRAQSNGRTCFRGLDINV